MRKTVFDIMQARRDVAKDLTILRFLALGILTVRKRMIPKVAFLRERSDDDAAYGLFLRSLDDAMYWYGVAMSGEIPLKFKEEKVNELIDRIYDITD